mgnify:CR=1 FL=1
MTRRLLLAVVLGGRSGKHRNARMRSLLGVPDDYAVLFLQGGATMQFAMVPLNLSSQSDRADYVQTGSWSKKAIAEARKFCEVAVVADSQAENFTRSAMAPEMSAAVMMAKVPWKAMNSRCGVAPQAPVSSPTPFSSA